jgi:hypothetical protein
MNFQADARLGPATCKATRARSEMHWARLASLLFLKRFFVKLSWAATPWKAILGRRARASGPNSLAKRHNSGTHPIRSVSRRAAGAERRALTKGARPSPRRQSRCNTKRARPRNTSPGDDAPRSPRSIARGGAGIRR